VALFPPVGKEKERLRDLDDNVPRAADHCLHATRKSEKRTCPDFKELVGASLEELVFLEKKTWDKN
jgi:hypothetical protein